MLVAFLPFVKLAGGLSPFSFFLFFHMIKIYVLPLGPPSQPSNYCTYYSMLFCRLDMKKGRNFTCTNCP